MQPDRHAPLADVRPAPSHEIAEQLGALRSLRSTIDIRVAVLLGVDFDVIASALHRLALTEARVKRLEDELATVLGQPLPVVHHYADVRPMETITKRTD